MRDASRQSQTTEPLPWWQLALLNGLDEQCSRSSADVGAEVWTDMAPRTRSAAARQHLKLMEAEGLVARLDDEKPIAWRRTPAGTARAATA